MGAFLLGGVKHPLIGRSAAIALMTRRVRSGTLGARTGDERGDDETWARSDALWCSAGGLFGRLSNV